MTNEIREWLTLGLTAIIAVATAATAILVWRDRKQPIVFDAWKERDGRLQCRLEFQNTTARKVVLEQITVTRPRDATVYERNRPSDDQANVLKINREIEPDKRAGLVFYVKSAAEINEFRAKLSVSRRLRTIRTSRYTIKRTIAD
jgi:hypothetical protein